MFLLFLAVSLSVTQQPYNYQSHAVLIPERPAFVVKTRISPPTPKHTLSKVEGVPLSEAEGIQIPKPVPKETEKLVLSRAEGREKANPLPIIKPPKIEIKEMEVSSIVETKKEAKEEGIQTKKRTEGTVYFDLDSCSLKESEKLKLDSLDRSKSYEIVGYTCDLGSKRHNDSLALRRALAVKDYLGVEGKVQGRGKCCYADKKDRAMNRRVEVKELPGN
jgi:outer membrane protein OmpA-like peptidoglycan-associated protein